MRKKFWLRKLCLLLLCPVSMVVNYGQDKPRSEMATRISIETASPQTYDLTAFSRTSAEIRKRRPDISESVLIADAQVIKASLPQITTEFWKVGLTDEDAVWASLRGWRAARLESPLRFNPDKSIDSASFIDHVTSDVAPRIVRWQIQAEDPRIPKLILMKDLMLIEDAQDEIAASYQKLGWSASDARNASLVAWKVARLESPLGPNQLIDQHSLIEFTADMGIMVFTSEPDQADVFLGSQKIGTTNKQKLVPLLYFPGGKKVTVRFTKPDFVSKDEECVARGQDTVVCKAELKRNQP